MEFIARNGSQSSVYDIKKQYLQPEYQTFVKSNHCKYLKGLIYTSFIELGKPNTIGRDHIQFNVHRLSGVLSMTKLRDDVTIHDIMYLQLHIAERLGVLGYIVNLSEHKVQSEHEKSYIIYLKPSLKLQRIDGKINQLYGNIHTEIKLKNNELEFFKIMSHRYNDTNYVAGDTFYDLIEAIFN